MPVHYACLVRVLCLKGSVEAGVAVAVAQMRAIDNKFMDRMRHEAETIRFHNAEIRQAQANIRLLDAELQRRERCN